MVEPQDAELDALFRLSPDAMVEARNALAARLRKAGARAPADQVKALKRPAPAAWALNQLHFEQPALLERARQCAEQVRSLHARDGVDARALAAAVAAQRDATYELMAAARQRWEAVGLPDGAQQQRKLLATIQGWLAGAGQEVPGRMTRDIEHGGFDAITAVGAPAVRDAAGPASAAALAGSEPAPPAARARTEVVARHERQLREARAQVRQQQAEQQRAARELDRAQEALRAAEARLAELREACAGRAAELARVQAALEAALSAQTDAEQALAAARAG